MKNPHTWDELSALARREGVQKALTRYLVLVERQREDVRRWRELFEQAAMTSQRGIVQPPPKPEGGWQCLCGRIFQDFTAFYEHVTGHEQQADVGDGWRYEGEG